MSRLFAAGHVARRRQGADTPIASAERLARFARDAFRCDVTGIRKELRTWRDRERLPLSDELLQLIAEHVAAEVQAAA